MFFLHKELDRDPFEVFWEDPRAVYRAMEKIFGAGTKVLINLIITSIDRECGLNMSPDRFLELMRSGSVKEIQSFLRKIAELYKSRGDT